MRFVTLTPIYTPLQLTAGLSLRSSLYQRLVESIPFDVPEISCPDDVNRYGDYSSLAQENLDLRLFIWVPTMAEGEPEVKFHVFPFGVSVAEVTFALPDATTAKVLENACQSLTRQTILSLTERAIEAFNHVKAAAPKGLLAPESEAKTIEATDIRWISRAIILSPAERGDPAIAPFIVKWLEETPQPEDADAILSGDLDYSIVWVNYILVEESKDEVTRLLAVVRTAQFFYAAQECLNTEAQNALTQATFDKTVKAAEQRLQLSRRRMQMLRIAFDLYLGLASAKHREMVRELVGHWNFDSLLVNGERIIEASNARISEFNDQKRERSSFFTDMILVTIALVTVIEVSLYFSVYSRELMSRPALSYNDSSLSWILRSVASIDTDAMLLGGALITLLLVLVYGYAKTRR